MKALDAMAEVEKTSIFGTAVHAVLRTAAADPGRAGGAAARRRPRGVVVRAGRTLARGRVPRRGRAERGRLMRKVLAVARKELRQIRRDRRSLLILLFVPAFFLLDLRLRAELRHSQHPARRPGRRPQQRQPRGDLGLRQLGLLRHGGRRRGRPRRHRHPQSRRRARGAGHSGAVRRRRGVGPGHQPCRSSSTATTPTRPPP